MDTQVINFLSKLGFNYKSDFDKEEYLIGSLGKRNLLAYNVSDIANIYFSYLSSNEIKSNLFELHQVIWNNNSSEVFIVVSDYETLLCSSKYKPNEDNPLQCKLDSFNYGINSRFTKEEVKELLKESVDYGYFWEFVRSKLQERKKQVVDDDLLLNLIQLKKDISHLMPPEKSYILIERCLFLKFLEDKGYLKPNFLLNILSEQNIQKLINKFDQINKKLNGDIFTEKIFVHDDISKDVLQRLYSFFTSDYRHQGKLFPYMFDVLPIELLSNIYETFLKVEYKLSGGIFYTPPILVNLILDNTLSPKLKSEPYPKCLDFSCGSGVFLVKVFEKLINKHKCWSNFELKKKILRNCIFGIEKDEVAARITIFSLYLKLLEGESSDTLRKSINANDIKFPKLFGKNILNKNTLFDNLIFTNEQGKNFNNFDVIVGNPPWGINPYHDFSPDNPPQMNLSEEKQNAVNDYQSSQYFLLKAHDFMSKKAIAGLVTNNSNFLINKGKQFRSMMLQCYDLETIYELTQCNTILFNKRKLESIEIGADEPATVLIFHKKAETKINTVKYIRPSLDKLSKLLKVIIVKSSEIHAFSQKKLEDDLLWRVLAVGDVEDYKLLDKLNSQKGDVKVRGMYGYQPTSKGEKIWNNVVYFDKDCIDNFFLIDAKKIDPNGVPIRRTGNKDYKKSKFLIKRYVGNELRIKAAFDNNGHRFKENLLGLIVESSYNDKIVLALLNSLVISYILSLNSSQIGKGTYNMMHKNEVARIPFPSIESIPSHLKQTLITLVNKIQKEKHVSRNIFEQIDEAVFKIYHLKDFEKNRVLDFFKVRERENNKKELANSNDIETYVNQFRYSFGFILKEDKFLNASIFISSTLGAGITFHIVSKNSKMDKTSIKFETDIGKFVMHAKNKQLTKSEKTTLLKQDKIKFYDKDSFTIIKSNHYKDWTVTEAIKDAKEEIELFFQSLPDK